MIVKVIDSSQNILTEDQNLSKKNTNHSYKRRQSPCRQRMKVFTNFCLVNWSYNHFFSSIAEVLLLETEVIVFKSGSDCKFYVCGTSDENELILLSVLEAVYDAVYSLMKGQVEKRTMLDNLELILLTIDEAVRL